MWWIILGVMGFFLLMGLLNKCLLVLIILWERVVFIGLFRGLWGMILCIYFKVEKVKERIVYEFLVFWRYERYFVIKRLLYGRVIMIFLDF